MSAVQETFGVVLCGLLVCASVVCFIFIQLYFADPRRREKNKEWFEQFEDFLRSRYSDKGLGWRVNVFNSLFKRA